MSRGEKMLIACAAVVVVALGVCTWLLLEAIHAESAGIMTTIERH